MGCLIRRWLVVSNFSVPFILKPEQNQIECTKFNMIADVFSENYSRPCLIFRQRLPAKTVIKIIIYYGF